MGIVEGTEGGSGDEQALSIEHTLLNERRGMKGKPAPLPQPFGLNTTPVRPFPKRLYNIPNILRGVTEFTTSHTGAETVVADADLLVDHGVGEVIGALGHGAHKHADALFLVQVGNVFSHPYHRRVEAQRYLSAVGREVVRDRVLDHLEQLLLRVGRSDRQAVQQLHHQPGEALEGSRDAHRRADLDEHPLRRVDVDLQSARFVDGRIEECEQTLD